MFKNKDGEDLRIELGLTDERANELVEIVQNIMNQEAADGEYGRTSHVLLDISGRKDLSEVERTACTFLFCCKIFGRLNSRRKREVSKEENTKDRNEPRIFPGIPGIPGILPGIIGMPNMKGEEFIDLERGISGMIVAPEGIDKKEMVNVIMTSLISLLRCLPKKDAKDFCRFASITFAKMALSGDIKL